MNCPNCMGVGCRGSGFMRVPNGEARHVVYGNCTACGGTGVIDWDDLVETFLSDWKTTQARMWEEEREERQRWEQEWKQKEEERKKKSDEAAQLWLEKQRLLVAEQNRLRRERAETEFYERWMQTMNLYGVPSLPVRFPPI